MSNGGIQVIFAEGDGFYFNQRTKNLKYFDDLNEGSRDK